MHRGCFFWRDQLLARYYALCSVFGCCALLFLLSFRLSIPPILCCLSGHSRFGVSSSLVTFFGVNSGCFFLTLFSHWQFPVEFFLVIGTYIKTSLAGSSPLPKWQKRQGNGRPMFHRRKNVVRRLASLTPECCVLLTASTAADRDWRCNTLRCDPSAYSLSALPLNAGSDWCSTAHVSFFSSLAWSASWTDYGRPLSSRLWSLPRGCIWTD